MAPSLPVGLTLDATTGIISGTPAGPSPSTVYTVTASNVAGSTQAQVTIAVAALLSPPSDLSYASAGIQATVGVAIPSDVPTVTGLVTSWAVSPDLPSGLTLHPDTGIIYGTPSAASAQATYTITASNDSGFAQATVQITVLPAAPTYVYYDTTIIAGTVGVPIEPDHAYVTEGADQWSVSPPLPPGLALDATSGTISGTPTAASPEADYVITAANVSGSVHATVRITIEAPVVPPSNLAYEQTEMVLTRDVDFVTNAPTVTGRVTSWSVQPALPYGLGLNATSGMIIGTPYVESARTAYVITASNEAGSTQATVYITVNAALAAPSQLQYARSSIVADEGVPMAADPAFVVGTVTSWSVSPPLPAGLVLSTVTGAITGTPGAPSSAQDYTVTAGNSAGSTEATIRIEVRPVSTPPTHLVYFPSSIVTTQGEPMAPAVPTYDGVVTAWAVSPALPAGLAFSINGIAATPAWAAANRGTSVAFDGVGNLYLALANVIRKMSPAGVVTVLAGSESEPGYANGAGAQARFNGIGGIAVDAAGNVWVADTDNYVVRKVAPDGTVTTAAGNHSEYGGWQDGPAASATFYFPKGIAIDGAGNVYIADMGAATIRKLDTAAMMVSTLAGSPLDPGSADGEGSAARFRGPRGIAVDAAGIIYVADYGNHTIRRVTPSGHVTTLAGAAGMEGSGDGQGAGAQFRYPQGVAVDAFGTVYVADTGNDMIRTISDGGDVITVAGRPFVFQTVDGPVEIARFYTPVSLVAGPSRVVYVAQAGGAVRTIDRRPGILYGTPSEARERITYTITASNSAGQAQASVDLEVVPADVITFAGTAGVNGYADGLGQAAQFFRPTDVAVDSAGNVYAADCYNHTIRKLTPAGEVTTLAGNPGSSGFADGTGQEARFLWPEGLDVDAAGNVYVADRGNNAIRRIAPGGAVTTLAGDGNTGSADGQGTAASFYEPKDVAVGAGGDLYVTDLGNHTLRKIAPDGTVSTLAGKAGQGGYADGTGEAARFYGLVGVVAAADGTIYVADGYNRVIRAVSPAGQVTTLAGSAGLSGVADGSGAAARFSLPARLDGDGAGNLWLADQFGHTVRRITPAGEVTTYAGLPGLNGAADGSLGHARFSSPSGVAAGPGGVLFVADTNNNTIRLVR